MSITIEDYHRALSLFLKDISRLEDDIACVLLYGSMARGDLRVGESDIDLCVFIRKEVFDVRERFLKVFETIVEASDKLMACGLPYQRCHYYSDDELRSLDAKFIPIWGGDEASKIVYGEDIRSRIASTEAGRFIARTVFFEGRRILLPLSVYFWKEQLTEQDCKSIFNDLFVIRKAIVQSACNALGAWPDTSNALQELERMLPDVDIDVFKRITALRGHTAEDFDPEHLREMLGEALALVEILNEKIIAEVKSWA
jgi:predicted nucleotidyltransferase